MCYAINSCNVAVCVPHAVLACRQTHLRATVFIVATIMTSVTSSLNAQDKPEGYEQILARGGIPAIDNPTYVAASEADIKDDSFVLGIVVEGQPLAFSLNLLNRHEVVNDTVGKTNFAAVW